MSLTEALRSGAPDVFGRLYDAYAPRLYAHCRAMVGDEAPDALRDTFTAAARHPGGPPDDATIPVWLHALARSECLRRGALSAVPRVGVSDGPLARALARLRPEHREVLVLSATLGTGRLARVLGVAADTAELLVRVARRRLEQAAVSVLGGAARDDDMLAALAAGTLHRLVAGSCDPPPGLRERVLAACAAAGSAVDGALLFDQDGLPIALDALFDPAAEAATQTFTRIDVPDPQAAPAPHRRPPGSHGRHRRRGTSLRSRGVLAETLGLAACVLAATGVLALWPAPDDGDASNVDRISVLVPSPHRTEQRVTATVPPGAGSPGRARPPATATGAATRRATPARSAAKTPTATPSPTRPGTPVPTPSPSSRKPAPTLPGIHASPPSPLPAPHRH